MPQLRGFIKSVKTTVKEGDVGPEVTGVIQVECVMDSNNQGAFMEILQIQKEAIIVNLELAQTRMAMTQGE